MEADTVADIERGRGTERGGERRGSRPLRAAVLAVAAFVLACGSGDAPGSGNSAASGGDAGSASDARAPTAGQTGAPEPVVATEEDWRIVQEKVEWGRSVGLDTVPLGEAVARMAATFVGTPYVARTLEVAGPERLVVNLRALDCVTLVETVLALVHVIREGPIDGGAPGPGGAAGGRDEDELRRAYRRALTRIRYRDGVLDGYPSRLHYFSEWIRNAQEKGLVREVTAELGGVEDPEPVNFMTQHPDSYRQLSDAGVRARIRRTEERISRIPRIYLPEGRIEESAPGIRDGDVIAATSTLPGLDVAHTGIALWRDGRLHLLHAPLVGDSVQISERTLARRILQIESQDGILVARPVEAQYATE